MKAIVTTRYGSAGALQLQSVEKPAPRDAEVLIKVHAATVTAGDVMLRRMRFPVWLLLRVFMGLKRKRIPGHELAGEIEAVGKDVTLFKKGDQVFGTTTGLSTGANAEYVCLPEKRRGGALAMKPANLSYAEAAAVPVGGMAALYLLRQANLKRAEKVLIYGASGSVGTYGVQLASQLGAEVTGVCSTRNMDMVRALGAGDVIDYTREEFTKNGERYDVIFDAVGKLNSASSKGSLAENGRHISVSSSTSERTEDLVFLRELIEAGSLRPVIDRCYPLEQAAEAHRYVETGRKKGNVVITV